MEKRGGSKSSNTLNVTSKSLTQFYDKGKELGKGTFGTVFEVTRKSDGLKFAGKQIM